MHAKPLLVAALGLSLCAAQVYAVSSRNVAISAVEIIDFAYRPSSGVSAVGSSVTWTNKDTVPHTVTFDNGEADSGPLATGQTFTFTFTQATRYSYHCTIHPSMTGYVDALPRAGSRMPRAWLPLVTQ